MTPKPIRAEDMIVSRIEHYTPTLFLLELQQRPNAVPLPTYKPGQFVQLQIPNCNGVFLRRPFSVYYSNSSHIGLLIQVVGRGSKRLYHSQPGDKINVLGPLGNSFLEPQGKHPLLIGGGVGLAPMLSLGGWLKQKGYTPTFLLGGRSTEAFPNIDMFKEFGKVYITTEDGSWGEKGRVTEHSLWNTIQISQIYTCGPTPMMKAIAKIAVNKGIPCQVSLENQMACGVGVCLCCVERTKQGHKCTCTEGPVFDIQDLEWQQEI